jgi:hypothetical protein
MVFKIKNITDYKITVDLIKEKEIRRLRKEYVRLRNRQKFLD